MGIIWSLLVGLAAGAIAGWIMKGKGFGFIVNTIVGLVGGLVGGLVYSLLGISTGGIWGSLVMSVVGAVILLYIISLVKKKK